MMGHGGNDRIGGIQKGGAVWCDVFDDDAFDDSQFVDRRDEVQPKMVAKADIGDDCNVAHVEAKTFKLLATTGNSRSTLAPHVPTMKELKKVNFGCTVWFGLFAKKTTESETIKRIQTALRGVLEHPSFRGNMTSNGYGVLALTGNEAVNYVQHSNADWAQMLPR